MDHLILKMKLICLKYKVSFNQSNDSVELIDRITGNIVGDNIP